MENINEPTIEIFEEAHDWCRVKCGDRKFELGLIDGMVLPEIRRDEIKKIKSLTLKGL